MTDRTCLYVMVALTMMAAMKSCNRLDEVMKNQEEISGKVAALEEKVYAVIPKAVSVELPKIQTEVENGQTNMFYMIGPTKVYVR